MSDDICWIITILYEDMLIYCALKMKRKGLEDVICYPMEPENRKIIHNFLPCHVRNMGPIVKDFCQEIPVGLPRG